MKAQRHVPRLSHLGSGRELLDQDQWADLARNLSLAPRELQVVQGVFDDLKEFAIADDLGISPHTVHTYLERVYRKLSVGSRVELVVRIFAEILAEAQLAEAQDTPR